MATAAGEEREETKNDLDVGAVVLTAVVGFGILYASVVGLQAFYYRSEDAQRGRVETGATKELEALRASQLQKIHGYAKDPSGSGRIQLPIERAMELVVTENSGADGAATAP